MAVSRRKYGVPAREVDKKTKGSETLGHNSDVDKRPRVLKDGTLQVENLKEVSSDGLSYELDKKNNTFFFSQSLDSNTQINYIPQAVDKVYKTTASFKGEVKEAFATFRSDVKKFSVKNMDRYKTQHKQARLLIDQIHKDHNTFLFTEKRGGDTLWNQIYRDVTNFGPYNYDVKLEVTKDIEFINDLIVIRSGGFATKYNKGANGYSNLRSGDGIAWVSPHDQLAYSGKNLYFSSGASYFNKASGVSTGTAGTLAIDHGMLPTAVSGRDVTYYVHALSSKFVSIPKGANLGSGMVYSKHNSDGTYDNLTSTNPLYGDFYYIYDEYQTNFNKTGWNGVIPSGSWFTIETWSTNPKYIGFDGEITIKPTGENDPTCTYSATAQGTASDTDYQESVRKAYAVAKKKFYKNLNKILISKGIRNKPSRLLRYERMLLRAAQDIFDGVTIIKNDQIAKVQGTESDPLNSPVYYDGTSEVYGGNQSNANYNPASFYEERFLKNKSSSIGSNSSGGSSGGGSY